MIRITIGELRKCKLPPAKPDEPEVLVSLRKTVDSPHPDQMRVAIPHEMAKLAAELTQTAGEPKSDDTAAKPSRSR